MTLRFTPPDPVLEVIFRLTAAGHEAYLVGGCVRDLLLCREPMDWDVCTSAHPNHVKTLFPGALETGLRHGTVTALLPREGQHPQAARFPVEITTFRAESGYGDHRHPDVVRFCSDLATDLARRDFTINAMAWSPETGLVDLFGGQLDLAERLVRCVGDPLHRFSEDALRMLRAIRFCAQLDFSLDPDTQQAILHHRNDILHISMERVQYEMTRTLTGKTPSKAVLWWETGLHVLLFDTLLPGLSSTCEACRGPAGDPTGVMQGLSSLPSDRLMALHLLDTENVEKQALPSPEVTGWALLLSAGELMLHRDRLIPWMRRLRFPNARMMDILKLIQLIHMESPPTLRNQMLAVSLHGKGWIAAAWRLRQALTGSLASETPSLPDAIPLPEGDGIQRLLDDGWVPQGRAFGAFLSCLQIAQCEQPLLTAAELPPLLVRAMRDAACRHQKGSVQSKD